MELKQLVDYELTEEELIIGYEKCKENVQNLLDGAERLLDTENTFQFALGLYIYAIEEYGKTRLLEKYREQKNYRVPGWIFGKDGKRAHAEKLIEGFSKLPSICKKLQDITNRANRLGIEFDNNNNTLLMLSEQQRIRNCMSNNEGTSARAWNEDNEDTDTDISESESELS